MTGTTGDPAPPHRASLTELIATDVPCVAAPFDDRVTDEELGAAVTAGLDVAELRIDLFADATPDRVVATARRFAHVPTVATIRSAAEGGNWSGDDAERLALFRAVAPFVDALDVEASSTAIADAVVAAAHAADALAIVSFHDFDALPPVAELAERAGHAKQLGADLVKLAVRVTAPDELRELAAFTLDHRDLGLIVIGMGPEGVATRLFFPFLGSRLTFATAGRATAPGQPDLAETVRTLVRCSPAYAARLADRHADHHADHHTEPAG